MITNSDAEVLIVKLQKNSGANAHTSGKAEFYLKKLIKTPNARFSNCSADQFVDAVRAAVYRGKWKELSDIMGRWW